MKTKYTLLISLLFTIICFSQPEIEWQKSFGGTSYEYANSTQQTNDGGYIIAGSARSDDGDVVGNHGGHDCWIIKLTSSGIVEWKKTIGGSLFDGANSVQQTTDGGYIIGGYTESNDGDVTNQFGGGDVWIVKLDDLGSIEWEKSFGGTAQETIYSIKQTIDGGFIAAGATASNDGDITVNYGYSDFWVVKLTATGILDWQKSYGGSQYEIAYSIQQTEDEGFIVVGYSFSEDGDLTENNGIHDYWILKLTPNGSIEWQKSYGGSSEERAYSIYQTSDGGYIVGGFSKSSNGDITNNHGWYDSWVIKINSIGVLEWEKSFGGSDYDRANSVQQTLDGGYIIGGYTTSVDGDILNSYGGGDVWILKLTSIGNIEWQKTLGGSGEESATSIQQTIDGGFIIGGNSNSDDGDLTNNQGLSDFWVVKLGSELGMNEYDLNTAFLYPNPTNGIVTIETANLSEINIYDSLGKLSFRQKMENVNSNTIDVSHLTKGVYTIHITTLEGKETKKLVIK